MAGFFQTNIVVIYFFYGLAFFSMGLAIWLESARARHSAFRLAYALLPLAAFGIIHGLNEWFDMFQLLEQAGATNIPSWLLLDELRIVHLVVSFLFLVVFGIRLIYANRRSGDGSLNREKTISYLGALLFLGVWTISLLATWIAYRPPRPDLLAAADVLARYTLAVPGAVLAGWAILLEQRAFKTRGMPGFGRALLGAAVALFIYGVVGQVFTRPSFLFPSNVINAPQFLEWFGFPIQLLRATMAALMAVFIIRALRVFELEDRQQLIQANEARLASQAEALRIQEQARAETDRLNRDLQAAVQDLSLLFSLSRRLAGTLDRSALLKDTVPMLVGALPQVNAGMLLLPQASGAPLEIVSIVVCNDPSADIAERRAEGIRLGEYVTGTGQPAWLVGREIVALPEAGDVALQEPEPESAASGGHTMAMPLRVQGKVIGSLVVCALFDAQPFTLHDAALMSTIADQFSIAIESATLYEQVRQHDRLRGELLHRVVSAQEAERQRIARELHDGTGQTLTALGLGLAAAADRIESAPAQTRQQLVEMKQLNALALQELHDVIANLRPSVLDNLGLVAALRGQVKTFEEHTGIQAHLHVVGKKSPRLKSDIETTVFRIAQEALTNVARHAQASQVQIQLVFGEEELRLSVQDDGRGFDPEAAFSDGSGGRTAWGLLGIRERATLVGGDSSIRSRPGEGAIVSVTIPNPYREAQHG